jgi:hypothetical protein
MRTTTRLGLTLALLGALFFPTSTGAAPACASNWFEVYKLEIKVSKKTYRMGDTAPITVIVTDAQTEAPVEGADVTVGVLTDDGYRYSNRATRSDENGIAKAKFALERPEVVPGWAEVRARASRYYDEGDPACAGLGLYGYTGKPKAFFVKDR